MTRHGQPLPEGPPPHDGRHEDPPGAPPCDHGPFCLEPATEPDKRCTRHSDAPSLEPDPRSTTPSEDFILREGRSAWIRMGPGIVAYLRTRDGRAFVELLPDGDECSTPIDVACAMLGDQGPDPDHHGAACDCSRPGCPNG